MFFCLVYDSRSVIRTYANIVLLFACETPSSLQADSLTEFLALPSICFDILMYNYDI